MDWPVRTNGNSVMFSSNAQIKDGSSLCAATHLRTWFCPGWRWNHCSRCSQNVRPESKPKPCQNYSSRVQSEREKGLTATTTKIMPRCNVWVKTRNKLKQVFSYYFQVVAAEVQASFCPLPSLSALSVCVDVARPRSRSHTPAALMSDREQRAESREQRVERRRQQCNLVRFYRVMTVTGRGLTQHCPEAEAQKRPERSKKEKEMRRKMHKAGCLRMHRPLHTAGGS